MSLKTVAISQSNYIPWKGYFDQIRLADTFVFYDDVQFTKRDWRNRNYVKSPNGLQLLTVPVKSKGKYHQLISETEIVEDDWREKHLKAIVQNYRKSHCFDLVVPFVETLYRETKSTNLAKLNHQMIKEICDFCEIPYDFKHSKDFEKSGDPSQKLLQICQTLSANVYLCGPASKNYLDEALFNNAGIEVKYMTYDYPEYEQVYPPFEHKVSMIDVLFSLGHEAKTALG